MLSRFYLVPERNGRRTDRFAISITHVSMLTRAIKIVVVLLSITPWLTLGKNVNFERLQYVLLLTSKSHDLNNASIKCSISFDTHFKQFTEKWKLLWLKNQVMMLWCYIRVVYIVDACLRCQAENRQEECVGMLCVIVVILLLLLLVCVSFTLIGQPRNSVLIRRV